MTSIWDDPDLRIGSDFVKFDKVGDTVTGRIVALRTQRWDDGSVAPQLFLDVNGEERTLTAGQVRLKAELAEQRPDVGDTITVTLSQVEPRGGGKTLKHFTVEVARAGATVDPWAPAAAPAAPAAGGLTAEQAAALKAAGLA